MPTEVRPCRGGSMGGMQIPDGSSEAEIITATGASQELAIAINAGQIVEVTTDVDVRIKIGKTPTATANSALVRAGQSRWFSANLGDKVAVILA